MLLVSLVLAAGGLDEAKAALAKFQVDGPVRGQLTVMRWQRTQGGDKPVESSSGATFRVADSPSGVSLQCAGGMLNDKAATIIGSMTLLRVHRLLDARADVLATLERATLVSEAPADWKGQPARRLELKVEKIGAKDAKLPTGVSVDVSAHSTTLWIDAHGLPLASDTKYEFEAGMMMVKTKKRSRVQREYAVSQGRLVVTRETEESWSDGVGDRKQVNQTSELQVEAAAE